MRVRRPSRNLRRLFAIGLGIAYLCGLALLLSPLWRVGNAESVATTPIRPVQGIKPLGVRPLGLVDVVPSRPPGVLPGEGGGGSGEFSGSETPRAAGETETGTTEGSESSEAVAGGGGPEGKSVIGFEG